MIQVAVMGYGTIGSGVVEVLETNKDKITEKTGKEIAVKYILDLREFPGDPHEAQIVHDFEIIEKDEEVEIVVEAMGGVNPAYKFAKACLLAGKHVVTSNKALVAAHGTELLAIAREKNLNFLFEASVGVMTMSEIIEQELAADGKHTHCNVVALSGPTHAEEVARDMPTLIVAGSPDEAAARKVQQIFTTPTFRVYTNTDRRGVELGGAVKNVIALAVGIAMGLDYGDNAKAALITRGNAELARLGVAMGCKAETFAGLSGMGDLIVTCTSMHSRNLHAGMLIGRGKDVETAKKEVGQVVEGINALPAACKLAKKYKVEMPIVNAVDDILSGRLAARDALATMMGRQLKQE